MRLNHRFVGMLVGFLVVATASTASADCADPLFCICPFGQDVAAIGVIEGVRMETTEQGFEVTIFSMEVESVSFGDGASSAVFAPGEIVDVNPRFDAKVGDRIVATGTTADPTLTEHQVILGGAVSCASGTFSEVEARELAVDPACRTKVEERVVIPECKDTVAPFDCSVATPSDTRDVWPWAALALACCLRRRR